MNIIPPIKIDNDDNKSCDKTCDLELQINTTLNNCKVGKSPFGLIISPGNTNYIQFNKTRYKIEYFIITKNVHQFIGSGNHEFELCVIGKNISVMSPITETYVKNSGTLFFDSILQYFSYKIIFRNIYFRTYQIKI